MEVAEQIAQITSTESGSLNPLHEVREQAKVDALVSIMAGRGWCGAPVVADDENAITGVHRIAAVTRLRSQHGIDVPIPRVQIADLCALYSVDWTAHLQDWAEPLADTVAYDWYDAVRTVIDTLPAEVIDYLGLDVN